MKKRDNKKGQIWVETVIYTLIAFALIGITLTFVKPKIDEIRDNGIIEQSLVLLEDLNDIVESLDVPGAQRVIQIGISKGELKIDGVNEVLVFEIETENEYSQSGENVIVGNVLVHTRNVGGDLYEVNMTINYDEYDLKYKNEDEASIIGQASTPYKLLISNEGDFGGESKTIINFEVVS